MGRTYYCWKCQDRHEAPSGRNCPSRSPFDENSEDEIEFVNTNQSAKDDAPATGGTHSLVGQQILNPQSEVKILSSRLDNLEELLYKLTDNLSKDPVITEKLSKSTSPVSDSSSPEGRGRSHRRHRHHGSSPSPSKLMDFDYALV